jgi:hypothetical protein
MSSHQKTYAALKMERLDYKNIGSESSKQANQAMVLRMAFSGYGNDPCHQGFLVGRCASENFFVAQPLVEKFITLRARRSVYS